MDRNVFNATIDGKDVELAVVMPNSDQRTEGQIVYSLTMKKAIERGLMLRSKLGDYLQNVWTDENQKELEQLTEELNAKIQKLNKGGIKVADGRKLALEIKNLRIKIANYTSSRTDVDNITADSMAEQARFDYLVSVCTVYNDTGAPVFKTVDDYKNRGNSDYGVKAASNFAALVYSIDPSFQEKLPENAFLKKFGFVDDKLRLVNEKGHLIDEDGHLIDEEGRYVNEAEEYVNRNGERVDKDGNLLTDTAPFITDVELSES